MSKNRKNKPRNRATALQREKRLEFIITLINIGVSPTQITQALQTKYGISERQAFYDLKIVRDSLQAEVDEKSDERIAVGLRRLEHLMSQAMQNKDFAEAAKLQVQIIELTLKLRKEGRGHTKNQGTGNLDWLDEVFGNMGQNPAEDQE